MTKKTSNRFSPEVRERAVRMVLEHGGDHASQWAAIGSIAAKIGCTAETLRKWVRQAERDQGQRAGPTTRSGSGSRRWSARTASCARPTRSCARRRRILRRRSSTADRSHDRVHRRSPRGLRGRADLQGAADRPVDLPRPCRAARRSGQGLAPGPAGRWSLAADPAGHRGELRGLRRPQGLAAARAGKASRWPAARWSG